MNVGRFGSWTGDRRSLRLVGVMVGPRQTKMDKDRDDRTRRQVKARDGETAGHFGSLKTGVAVGPR